MGRSMDVVCYGLNGPLERVCSTLVLKRSPFCGSVFSYIKLLSIKVGISAANAFAPSCMSSFNPNQNHRVTFAT